MLKYLRLKMEEKIKTIICAKETSFCIDDEKLVERYKPIWIKIEDIESNVYQSLMIGV